MTLTTTMFLKNIFFIFISGAFAFLVSFLLNLYTPYQFKNISYLLYYFCGLHFASNLLYIFTTYSTAFTEIILTSLISKLLIAFAVIIVYSLNNSGTFFNFSMHFVAYYILFTIFGVAYLLQLIKHKQIKP